MALLFLVAGILSSWISSPSPITLALFCGLILMACTALYFWMRYPPIFLCMIFALAGFIGMRHSLNDVVLQADNVELTGIVQDMRYTRTGWQRLVVVAEEGIFDINDEGLALILARPGVHILTFLSPEYRVQIGQRVHLAGNLYPIESHEFAGRFNARSIETFDIEMNLARATYVIRNRLADVYNAVLPFRETNLIQSIVLGHRPDMDDPVVDMYRNAGIFHLLVVSGLHLSMLMMVLCLVLELFLNKRTAGVVALIFIIAYTILTGASISTIRAASMAGVMVFGRLLYRDRDALSSVSFACIVLLLIQPMHLFSIGFQLSFGTVFGIVLLVDPTERTLSLIGMPPYGKFRQAVAFNIVASVSTYPILAYHFSYISTYSILINLIIAPTFALLVIMGMLTGLVGLLSMGAAAFLAGTVYFILRLYESVISFFLSLPGAVLLVGNWGLFVTLSALALMLAYGYCFNGFGADFRKRTKVLGLAAFIFVIGVGFEASARRRPTFTELDIGSYVIRTGGYTFVVNGGGNNRLLGMNTGFSTLMPYLDRWGVRQADAAFITGTTRGQIMGIIELAMEDRVRVLYVPEGLNMESGLGLRLQVEADRNNIPIYRIEGSWYERIEERLQGE